MDWRYPGSTWSPLSLVASDRFGHKTIAPNTYWRSQLTGEGYPFFGFCAMEPAWKLTAWLARNGDELWPADYRWRTNQVRLPQPQMKDVKQHKIYSRGRELRVQDSFQGPTLRTAGSEAIETVAVQVSVPRDTPAMRVVLTHVNGESTTKRLARFGMGPTFEKIPVDRVEMTPENFWRSRVLIPVGPTDRDKPLNLHLAGYIARKVEFVVKP